eukprot:scaffold1475_cov346-Prasinococcus_capsulatus_cf.AAC.3
MRQGAAGRGCGVSPLVWPGTGFRRAAASGKPGGGLLHVVLTATVSHVRSQGAPCSAAGRAIPVGSCAVHRRS